MAAAACSEDREGDLGDGGLGREVSALLMEILRGRCGSGVPEVVEGGSELRSGGIVLGLFVTRGYL